MKYCVSSYSFSQLTSRGTKKEIELIALAASMGFNAIEFAEINPPEGEDKIEYAKKLRAEAENCKIEIAAYAIGANLLKGQSEIDRLKNEVLVCEALGAKLMRHDATGGYEGDEKKYKGFENALPAIIRGYSEVTEFAAEHGIRTCIENHGFFCQASARVERIITGVANPNFGAIVDIGNFLCADEDPAEAVGRMASFAFHVHAKDFHVKSGEGFDPGEGFFRTKGGNYLRGAIIGQGNVPVAQCIGIIKRSGYDGYITVEFEGMEDCLKGIRIGLENLKRAVKAN